MLEALFAVLAFAFVATITPGGGTTVATSLGMQVGYRAALPFFLGNVLSAASLIGLSAVGIGALMNAAPALEMALKICGTIYLLVLAGLIATAGVPARTQKGTFTTPGWKAGALMSLLNPKVWTLAVGAGASFSPLMGEPAVLGALLAISFLICGLTSLSFWCLVGAGLRNWIKADAVWHLVNAVLAVMLAATIVPIWLV